MKTTTFRQSGAALISALLIVALVATISMELLKTLDRWQNITTARSDAAQARWLALAGVDYARAILAEDTRRGAVDHLGEAWASPLPPTEVEGGRIGGSLEDLQGRWNLNNLAPAGRLDEAGLATYRRLLAALNLPDALAFSLADWLDADEETRPQGGAESNFYLARNPPARSGNRPLSDLEELSRVRGYDAIVIARLAPHVSVLPGSQPVNINTASPLLLTVVQPGLTLADAEALVSARKSRYFTSSIDFRQRLPGELPPFSYPVGAASQNFLASVTVSYGLVHIRYQALLRRVGSSWPKILFMRAL